MGNPSISSKIVPSSKSWPAWPGRERPDGPVRARAESCTGPDVHGQERRNCHGRTVAGFVAGETKIDMLGAGDASYPGFFQEMPGGPVA
ncbi:MAG: hypothetical protein WCP70_05535 [Methanothrix sp.]